MALFNYEDKENSDYCGEKFIILTSNLARAIEMSKKYVPKAFLRPESEYDKWIEIRTVFPERSYLNTESPELILHLSKLKDGTWVERWKIDDIQKKKYFNIKTADF